MEVRFSTFGEKLTAQSGILQLMDDLGKALRAEGPVYMLGGGNPAKIPQVVQFFRERLQALAQDEARFLRAFTDYAEPQGLGEFREALARLFRERYGWPIGPENVVLTNGSQNAFALLFNLLAGPASDGRFRKILLPVLPEYIGYADTGWVPDIFLAMKPTIELLDAPFYKYHVDLSRLPDHEDVAAVCVSRPTNPTGNVLTEEELDALAQWSRERGVPFIIDNAYGAPFPYILFTDAEPYWDEHVVLALSLSKVGLPGVRTGIILAPEPIARALARMNAIFSLAPGSVGPGLVLDLVRSGEILELGPRWIQPYYRAKRDRALEWLEEFMGDVPYRVHLPEGTFFLWVWFPELPISAQELYQRLKARRVLVVPGQYFFPGLQAPWDHQHQCLRINFAGPEEVVREGLRRLARLVREVHEAGEKAVAVS